MKQTFTRKSTLLNNQLELEVLTAEGEQEIKMPEMVSPSKGVLQSILNYSRSLNVEKSESLGQISTVMN